MTLSTEIKSLFDDKLILEELGTNFNEQNTNAIKLFQKLFVEKLNFELIQGIGGSVAEEIPVDDWNKSADAQEAFFIARSDEINILYIVIEKLTRYRERFALSSLRRERWARKGEYVSIFYAPNSSIWHMVCPYSTGEEDTSGRLILRRYVLGEGENHRTVSENLTLIDASQVEPLFERIQKAFKVRPVTEQFYEDYKEIFSNIKRHLLDQGIQVAKAKKYAHLLLNRLMFIYFIQKKKWLNNDKNFLFNFLKKYKSSGDVELFYEKWLSTLFFEAMSKPINEKAITEFSDNAVNNLLNNIPYLNGGLFEKYDVDIERFTLSDDLLFKIIEDFLEYYNFTITEESPFDLDIAIDPAMLGKIYESLIAEEERGKAGIFYTPRIEVDLMCRLGIYEYFLQDRNEILTQKDGNFIKELLIQFIFTPLEDWDIEKKSKFEFIRKAMNNVKIVDPACGSGAFLVGMLQILIELYRKLGKDPDFDLKENIIYNTLYGADIKDWAIRMAEFRLWLSLVEKELTIPNKQPILPNFSLKLKCGDSIIQKIGKEPINLNQLRKKNLTPQLKNELTELNRLKKHFFEGDKDLLKTIKEKQIGFIIKLLKTEIRKYKSKNKTLQKDLQGKLTKKAIEEKKENDKKIQKNNELIEIIKEKKNELFFWDLSFPEVMSTGGFDIVIENPPYIRQESIMPQDLEPEELEKLSKQEIKQIRDKYKKDLEDYVKIIFDLKTGRTCDMYVFFFFKSLELLNRNGIYVIISSNTWLDSNFGQVLQEGLIRNSQLKMILNNQSKRSFEQADVNTVISVGVKRKIRALKGIVQFISLNKAFENYLDTKKIQKIVKKEFVQSKKINLQGENIYLNFSDIIKKVLISEESLWKIGGGIVKIESNINKKRDSIKVPDKNYELFKWSKFLRAPEIYFKIIEKSKDNFTRLGDVLKRGYTSGANNFYYLGLPGKKNRFFISKFNENKKTLDLYPKNNKVREDFKKFVYNSDDPLFSIEKKYWTRSYDISLEKFFEEHLIVEKDEEKIFVPNYLIKSPKELVNADYLYHP
jgi:methylase of polypeptide subunit release factors